MKGTLVSLLTLLLAVCHFATSAQEPSRPEAKSELNSFYSAAVKAFATKDANVDPPADDILKSMKPFQAKYRAASCQILAIEVQTKLSDDKQHQTNVARLIVETTYTKPKRKVKPAKLVLTYKDIWQQNEKRDYAWELRDRTDSKDTPK